MTGRILTVIDSSITNRKQRKAVKDLINIVIFGENPFNVLEDKIKETVFDYEKKSEKDPGGQLSLDGLSFKTRKK
jgi:hypothetical protein